MNAPASALPLRSLVALHFVPAIAVFATYLVAASRLVPRGVPPSLVLNVAFLTVGIPAMLLILRRRALIETGSHRISEVIKFRSPISIWAYVLLVPLFIAYAAVLSGLLSAPTGSLQSAVDSRSPGWIVLPHLSAARTAIPAIIVLLSALLVDGLLNPFVEEVYFRGYLLPRLSPLGLWAPAVHGVLFALAHLWQPHNIPFLILLVVPLYYVVWRLQNFYLAVAVHCLANLIGVVLSA